jgi:hypothetical protein
MSKQNKDSTRRQILKAGPATVVGAVLGSSSPEAQETQIKPPPARGGFEGIQEASVIRDKVVASKDAEAKRALRDALNKALTDQKKSKDK